MMTTTPNPPAHLAPGARPHRSRASPWAATLAAAIAGHGSLGLRRRARPGAPGTAAAQLERLTTARSRQSPPSGVSAGFAGASADTAAVRLLGANAGGLGPQLYAAARANGGACNALSNAKGGVGTTCVDDLPPSGITPRAPRTRPAGRSTASPPTTSSASTSCSNGKAQPATMLPNAYVGGSRCRRPERRDGCSSCTTPTAPPTPSPTTCELPAREGRAGAGAGRRPPPLLRERADDLISPRWSGDPTSP